jgi:hypothetical protein
MNADRPLRDISLIVTGVAAGGSLVLMFIAGRNSPRMLLVMFTFWVLAPFAALTWAIVRSATWPALTRATLHGVAVAVAVGSLALYTDNLLRPPRATAAFRYVAVPAASWVLMAAALAIAAIISRRRAQRDTGT